VGGRGVGRGGISQGDDAHPGSLITISGFYTAARCTRSADSQPPPPHITTTATVFKGDGSAGLRSQAPAAPLGGGGPVARCRQI